MKVHISWLQSLRSGQDTIVSFERAMHVNAVPRMNKASRLEKSPRSHTFTQQCLTSS